MPTVSLILPAYNCEEFIAETLDSVFGQTRVPDQIIVVNDGSTDRTADIVRRYRDSRLHYVEQENRGIAAARNRGLSLATGEYLMFLDADDIWRPTMVEKQLATLEADPSLVCSITNLIRFVHETRQLLSDQFRYFPLDSLRVVPGPIENCCVIESDAFCALVAFHSTPCNLQTTILRASAVQGIRFDEALAGCEDYEFVLRVYLRGRVALNREILADIRRHGSNTTRDFEWAHVIMVDALRAIQNLTFNQDQLLAYRDRLVKAHMDAAALRCSRRQILAGARTYCEGLAVPGSGRRKIRAIPRILWETCRGLVGHTPRLG